MDDEAWHWHMEREGGGVLHNVPGDPGGLTKFGIAQNRNPDLHVADLTEAEARGIIERRYWKRAGCDVIAQSSPALALVVFDCAVNQGVAFAVEVMQELVGCEPDGVFGPKTAAAVADAVSKGGQRKLIAGLIDIRQARYMRHPRFSKFGRGWMNRLALLERRVEKMLGGA